MHLLSCPVQANRDSTEYYIKTDTQEGEREREKVYTMQVTYGYEMASPFCH